MWKAWRACRLLQIQEKSANAAGEYYNDSFCNRYTSFAFGIDLRVPSPVVGAATVLYPKSSTGLENRREKAHTPSRAVQAQTRTPFSVFVRGFASQRSAQNRDENMETSDLDEADSDADLFEEFSPDEEIGGTRLKTRKTRVKRVSSDDSTENDEASTGEDELSTEEEEESKDEHEDEFENPLDKAGEMITNLKEKSQRQTFLVRIRKGAGRSKASVEAVIGEWIKEGNVISREVIVGTITNLRRNRKYDVALQVSDWVMNEKPFQLNDLDYSFRLELISKVHSMKKAVEYFTKIPKEFQSQMAYSILIAIFVERGAVTKAKNLLRKVENLGLGVPAFMYNQLLLLLKREGKTKQVVELVRKMEGKNVQADVFTYNILLDMKARKGDVKGIDMIMSRMKENGVKPDGITYSMMAKGCLAAGLPEKAEQAMRQVESAGSKVASKRAHYYVMLQLYAELRNVDEIERVWTKIVGCPNTYLDDYIRMIEALGRIGKVERAEEIFKEMWQSAGTGRIRQLNALLSVYTKQGMIHKAEELVKQMTEESLCPDCATFHYLTQMYVNLGLEQKVIEVLGKLEQNMVTRNRRPSFSRSRPWYATIQLILEMFMEKGDVTNAERAFSNLKSAGYKAVFKTYLILLNSYVKAGVTPYGFLDRMRADGNIPNAQTRAMIKQLNGT